MQTLMFTLLFWVGLASREDAYRGTSLIRNALPLGSNSSPVPRGIEWSCGGQRFLMGEVPLQIFIFAPLDRVRPTSRGDAERGTSLIRKRDPLGPYSRTMPGDLWWS